MKTHTVHLSFSLDRRFVKFEALLLALVILLTFVTSRTRADTGICSGQTITLPFTDVMGNGLFCSIAHIYFQGITLGTSPTTYGPAQNVTRDQMAAFLARSQNSTLQRGSRRAALNQFWTTVPQYGVMQGAGTLGTTAIGLQPRLVASDGADLWVANSVSGTVSRVRASDGKVTETWTDAHGALGVLVATGRVFVTGSTQPSGLLYLIDPSRGAGAVTTIAPLMPLPRGIAFDGQRIWTAHDGTVSIITPGADFMVSSVSVGLESLFGVIFDGANIWVTENGSPGRLKKLDAAGAVVNTVTVGNTPFYPIFDGTNIWVPNGDSNSVSVVRPADGAVLATLTGNGLSYPISAAFDGQRVLITNNNSSVSLFRAADFTPLGWFSTGENSFPYGVCSDGANFWITLRGGSKLARF